jgi:hypothetical protein
LAPELLTVTLEASGGGFFVGYAQVYDPYQMPLRDLFTNYDGDQDSHTFHASETGFYLIEIGSNAGYFWSLTVNWSTDTTTPFDGDNDLANATQLAGPLNATNANVSDWQDLFDLYAFNLSTRGARADALWVNLTGPISVDIDLWLYHIVGGVAVVDAFSITPTQNEYLGYYPAASGTYYLRVISYRGSTPYGLVWEIRDESADANNKPSLASAPPAGLTLNNLSRWDGRDVFLLNVTANTTVNATMHTVNYDAVNRTPDLQAVLWDADFNRVTWSFLFDPDERIDALLVLPGTYYLDIFPASQAYFVTQQMQFDYWLNVTIDPPPRLVDPSFALTTPEDTLGAIDLAALVAQEPAGEALAFRVMGVSGSISATMGVDGHTVSVAPAPDWSGSASVTIEARDRWSAVTFVVPVIVTPANDPPRLVPGASPLLINEDTPATFALSSAVYDPDGDSMTLVGFNATATLNVSFDGVFFNVVPSANYSGISGLVLHMRDSLGAVSDVTIEVLVLPVNDAPRFSGPFGPLEIPEDADASLATFSLAGLVVDPDGDAVTLSFSGPSEISGLIANGTLTLIPAVDFNGDLEITLMARDATLSATLSVTLHVAPVNDPPTLHLSTEQRLSREGAEFHLDVPATDIDTPASQLRYSFLLDGVALVNDSADPSFSYSFDFESEGFHGLRVVVSDGSLGAAADVSIFVSGVNRPPEAAILTPTQRSLPASEVVTFSARGADPDGDTLSFRWIVDGSLASSSSSFTMENLAPGKHRVELYVTDGQLEAQAASDFEITSGLPGPPAWAIFTALSLATALAVIVRRR